MGDAAGVTLTSQTLLVSLEVDTATGKSADVGAYDLDATTYWIPGRQTPAASTPVPPDGATNVRPSADLMFLGGAFATSHVVYLDGVKVRVGWSKDGWVGG